MTDHRRSSTEQPLEQSGEIPRIIADPDLLVELIPGSEHYRTKGMADGMREGEIVSVETDPADYTEVEAKELMERVRDTFFENLAGRIGVSSEFVAGYLKHHGINPDDAIRMPADELDRELERARDEDLKDREPGDSRFHDPSRR